jgi:hypothetical protein
MPEFFRAYSTVDSQCSLPEEEHLSTFDWRHKPIWEKTEPKYWEETKYESEPTKPIFKTHRIEKLDEVCFSKRPVAVCPVNTYASVKSTKISMEYICLPRHTSLTDDLLHTPEMELPRRLREITRVESTMTRRVVVPTLCTPYTESMWSKDFEY